VTKTWLVSDTHFGHHNAYNFTDRYTGERIRPWASNADEGDELMRTLWNECVKPGDKVYHLGDVAIPRRGLKQMEGLHGRKVLIRGNHDIFKMKDYAEYFDDIRGTHKLGSLILSHYPLHRDSIPVWCSGNVHGHTHSDMVWTDPGVTPDPLYTNICVEHTNASPIDLNELLAIVEDKQ